MGDPQHTPGPWSVYAPDPLIIVDAEGSSLGEMSAGDPDLPHWTQRANATLAAAAPDLLAELQRTTEHVEAWARFHPEEATTETWAAVHCARSAIAKALTQTEGAV